MIYTDNTKKALKLCFAAHKEQKDKSGLPYVFHPFHLAEQMEDEESTVVALLHDVAEDTDHTLADIAAMRFSRNVMEALALLTHAEAVPYMEYVKALRNNLIARRGKLADLRPNSDLSRLDADQIDEKALARVNKYAEAIKLLEERENSV